MRFPKLTREKIRLAGGKPVEVVWPSLSEPKVGHRYTIQASHRAGRDALVVLEAIELANGWRVKVRLDADHIRLLGRKAGYTDSPSRAIRCFTAATEEATSFRPEYEPEAVDEFTQRQITRQAHNAERDAIGELAAAAEEVRSALRERMESNPDFRRMAGRSIWRVRSELDRLIRETRRRAA